jgi:hypothetical protein
VPGSEETGRFFSGKEKNALAGNFLVDHFFFGLGYLQPEKANLQGRRAES